MKTFFANFLKILSFVFLLSGIIGFAAKIGGGSDEDVIALYFLIGGIFSWLLFFSLHYIVKAAQIYIHLNKEKLSTEEN